MHTWFNDYMLVMLRIEKIMRLNGRSLVESYRGPMELRNKVLNEGNYDINRLIELGNDLIDKVYELDIISSRKYYMEKQLYSMITLLKQLKGNTEDFEILVDKCLDIELKWVPDIYFNEGLRLIDDSIIGYGDLKFRYNKWQMRNMLNIPQNNKKKLIENVIEEIKDRTSDIVDLPDNDVNLVMTKDNTYGAAFNYLGNYRSRIRLSGQVPLDLISLAPLMSHEIYPGHHTEYCVKEKIYKAEYPELLISTVLSPQLVVTEGIAESAFGMIFDYDEADKWMKTNLYEKHNIKTDDVQIGQLLQGLRRNSLDQLSNNIVIMLNDNRPRMEIFNYIKKFTLIPDMRIHMLINNLDNVFKKLYAVTYFEGKRLVSDYINRHRDKKKAFYDIISKPAYPSIL